MTNKWNTDLSKYTGENENANQTPRLPVLDEIKLHGTDGDFVITHKTQQKVKGEETNNEVYPKTTLKAKSLDVILVRINRRRLVASNQNGVTMQTNEHANINSNVVLYNYVDKNKNTSGIAADLRKQFGDQLKTQQICYVLYEGQLYRLILKGGQISLTKKPKEISMYYDYVSGFAGEIKPFMLYTKMTPKAVKSSAGKKIYTLHFERGDVLTEDADIALVQQKLVEIGEQIIKHDEWYKTNKGTTPKGNPESNIPTINYDEPAGNSEFEKEFAIDQEAEVEPEF